MREEQFDLVVIGSGSGLDVAIGLVEAGWRVAVVEKGEPGGTCLNRGCIPSKMLIHSADLARAIRGAQTFGLHARIERIDYAALMRRVREHVDGDSNGMREGLRESGNARYFEGEGGFVGPKRLAVGDVILTADKFLLATGARPKIPDIPGLKEAGFWTSTDALREPELPESIVIIGGGFIAAELGHFFGALGTRVTIVQKHDVLLPREDREVSEAFTAAFSRSHDVRLESKVTRVEKLARGKRVTIRGKAGRESVVECSHVLVAAGVTPNSDALDLPKSGVAVDKRGYIVVDQFLETNVPGIYALGDVVGRFLLKHNANHEGQYVYNNLLNPNDKIPADYGVMPRAVFSDPQVAAVGAAEQQLRESGVEYLVGRYSYEHTGMGSALAEKDGFVKILADAESGRILGCHILGPDASTLIHEVLVVMTLGAPVEVLARTVHIHPALSEVVQRAAGALKKPE
ncbi:MAG: dihydrolipoyl dehydrogenase [Candidatus Thermoplasmatota archaeon]